MRRLIALKHGVNFLIILSKSRFFKNTKLLLWLSNYKRQVKNDSLIINYELWTFFVKINTHAEFAVDLLIIHTSCPHYYFASLPFLHPDPAPSPPSPNFHAPSPLSPPTHSSRTPLSGYPTGRASPGGKWVPDVCLCATIGSPGGMEPWKDGYGWGGVELKECAVCKHQ